MNYTNNKIKQLWKIVCFTYKSTSTQQHNSTNLTTRTVRSFRTKKYTHTNLIRSDKDVLSGSCDKKHQECTCRLLNAPECRDFFAEHFYAPLNRFKKDILHIREVIDRSTFTIKLYNICLRSFTRTDDGKSKHI